MNPAGGLTYQSQKQLMGSQNPPVPRDVLCRGVWEQKHYSLDNGDVALGVKDGATDKSGVW